VTATGHDVDAEAIAAAITDALSPTSVLPELHKLGRLDEQLRAEICRLTPIVRTAADSEPPRSREWYRLHNELGRAADATAPRMPDQPLAASLHVAELARRACALRQIEGEQR